MQVVVHIEVDTVVVPAVDVYSVFVNTNPLREDNLFRPYVIASISVRLDRHLMGLAYFLIIYVHMDLDIVDAVLVLNLVLHDEFTRVSRREEMYSAGNARTSEVKRVKHVQSKRLRGQRTL